MYVRCESMFYDLAAVDKSAIKQDDIYEEEKRIIADIKAGDINQYEKLIVRYSDYVVHILEGHIPYNMVNELAQDVFLKAFMKLDTFKFNSAFKTWLTKIAYNVCYDYWRENRKHMKFIANYETELTFIELISQHQINEADDELKAKASHLLHKILQEISPIDQKIISELYLKESSVKAVASELGLSETNVKVRAFRSRRFIRKKLLKIMGNK